MVLFSAIAVADESMSLACCFLRFEGVIQPSEPEDSGSESSVLSSFASGLGLGSSAACWLLMSCVKLEICRALIDPDKAPPWEVLSAGAAVGVSKVSVSIASSVIISSWVAALGSLTTGFANSALFVLDSPEVVSIFWGTGPLIPF